MRYKTLLLLLTSFANAQILLQASYGQQVSPSFVRMSGYQVDYQQQDRSPYDVGIGYMLSFKDMFVMPVMLEANPVSLANLYDKEAVTNLVQSPLELLLKPGVKFDEHEVFGLVGYQLGDFSQVIANDQHRFEVGLMPNFYGAGYSKAISEYLDYTAEVKVYYQSERIYGIDPSGEDLDKSFRITDSACRLGLRVRI